MLLSGLGHPAGASCSRGDDAPGTHGARPLDRHRRPPSASARRREHPRPTCPAARRSSRRTPASARPGTRAPRTPRSRWVQAMADGDFQTAYDLSCAEVQQSATRRRGRRRPGLGARHLLLRADPRRAGVHRGDLRQPHLQLGSPTATSRRSPCSWTTARSSCCWSTCRPTARSATSSEPVRRPAGGAGAEDLQGVADVGEAVLAGDPVGPLLDRRAGHLDGQPAAAADQVVVVLRAAAAVERLAGVGADGVQLAVVGQRLHRPVDRGQPDRVAVRRAAARAPPARCGSRRGPGRPLGRRRADGWCGPCVHGDRRAWQRLRSGSDDDEEDDVFAVTRFRATGDDAAALAAAVAAAAGRARGPAGLPGRRARAGRRRPGPVGAGHPVGRRRLLPAGAVGRRGEDRRRARLGARPRRAGRLPDGLTVRLGGPAAVADVDGEAVAVAAGGAQLVLPGRERGMSVHRPQTVVGTGRVRGHAVEPGARAVTGRVAITSARSLPVEDEPRRPAPAGGGPSPPTCHCRRGQEQVAPAGRRSALQPARRSRRGTRRRRAGSRRVLAVSSATGSVSAGRGDPLHPARRQPLRRTRS